MGGPKLVGGHHAMVRTKAVTASLPTTDSNASETWKDLHAGY